MSSQNRGIGSGGSSVASNDMSQAMYDTLGSGTLDKVWTTVRQDVLPDLLTGNCFVVPYIDRANCYGLFETFVKEAKGLTGQFSRTPGQIYRNFGKLDEIMIRNETYKRVVETLYKEVELNYPNKFPPEFVFEAKGNAGHSLWKRLRVAILGTMIHTSQLHPVEDGAIRISRTISGLRRVYIVNEAYVSESVRLEVDIGSVDRYNWQFPGPITLAFKLRKFAVNTDAMLTICKKDADVLPKLNETRTYHWEKPAPKTHS